MFAAQHMPIRPVVGTALFPGWPLAELAAAWRPSAPAALRQRLLMAAQDLAAPEPTRGLATAAADATGDTADAPTNGRAGDDDGLATDGEGPNGQPAPPFNADGVTMEDLIKDHADAVYRVALSVTRDPILAEDASQDALIKAWQALPSFRGDSPLRNWILRITHNTAISLLRKRRDELRDPDLLPERVSLSSVESQVQDRIAIDRFEEALQDLDDVSRSIVVLREVEGLSYAELCEVLDLPMPTVKTRLLRARRQLAVALEGWKP